MKKLLAIFALSLFIALPSYQESLFREEPLKNSIHYTVSIGYQKGVDVDRAEKIIQRSFDVIREQLNIHLTVVHTFEVDLTGSERPGVGLIWGPLSCRAQSGNNLTPKQYVDFTICLVDFTIGGMAAGVALPPIATVESNIHDGSRIGDHFLATNTLTHEIGHLLGASHSRTGVMFYATRITDYYQLHKFSNFSIREIKEHLLGQESAGND